MRTFAKKGIYMHQYLVVIIVKDKGSCPARVGSVQEERGATQFLSCSVGMPKYMHLWLDLPHQFPHSSAAFALQGPTIKHALGWHVGHQNI